MLRDPPIPQAIPQNSSFGGSGQLSVTSGVSGSKEGRDPPIPQENVKSLGKGAEGHWNEFRPKHGGSAGSALSPALSLNEFKPLDLSADPPSRGITAGSAGGSAS